MKPSPSFVESIKFVNGKIKELEEELKVYKDVQMYYHKILSDEIKE